MCVDMSTMTSSISPATAGNISLGVQAAGIGMSAYSAYNQSKAAKQAYEYQAAVARNQAQVQEWQAQQAQERGKRSAQAQQMKTAQMTGAQRARFAAAGLDLSEGSPFNILMDTQYFGKMDESTILANAENEAWALRESAKTGRSNSEFLASRAAGESPGGAAFSSLLTGAGSVASTWYRLRNPGSAVGK